MFRDSALTVYKLTFHFNQYTSYKSECKIFKKLQFLNLVHFPRVHCTLIKTSFKRYQRLRGFYRSSSRIIGKQKVLEKSCTQMSLLNIPKKMSMYKKQTKHRTINGTLEINNYMLTRLYFVGIIHNFIA